MGNKFLIGVFAILVIVAGYFLFFNNAPLGSDNLNIIKSNKTLLMKRLL